jgi:hypothetical protein
MAYLMCLFFDLTTLYMLGQKSEIFLLLKNFILKLSDHKSPMVTPKGQLILKELFGILNSPKKRMKKFNFTTMIPQVDLFFGGN